MKKEAELKTPLGQSAWHYYQLWMRQQKRMPPPANTFLTSKLFRTFINFAKFTQRVTLPRPEKFIQLMCLRKFSPILWTSDEVYVIYLEYLDRNLDPMEQAKISIGTLLSYADKHNIDVAEVFNKIPPNELIHMLRLRQVSPWLLINSKQFGNFYANKTSPEQRVILESIIQPSYWYDRKEKFPAEVIDITRYVEALGL
jgi:hypothetical protein